MIYKAFLNRQEITGFPVKGKETSEIWGGNTLLWKKELGTQGEIERYNLSRIIHCGERAILFFVNNDASDYGKDWTYFMLCTVKKTYPYYEAYPATFCSISWYSPGLSLTMKYCSADHS